MRWRPGAEAKGSAPVPTKVQRQAGIPLPAAGFGPADIAAAYQIDTTRKVDQTVAIVVAYDNPNLEADLAVYRAAFGLPPCTSANGCFRKVNQRGEATPPEPSAGWGVEAAMDVQVVSAACPTCKILVVHGDTPRADDLGKATATAVRLGADVVNHSFGATEHNRALDLGRQYYTHPGVPMVVASGDDGFTTAESPASLPNVIAVGGTTLTRTTSGWDETVWQGAGSGCSAWVPKPTWQKDRHCPMRTTADIAAVADPATGMAFYDTHGLGDDAGWLVGGGTSQSAPLIAGWIALAGNADTINDARTLYATREGRQNGRHAHHPLQRRRGLQDQGLLRDGPLRGQLFTSGAALQTLDRVAASVPVTAGLTKQTITSDVGRLRTTITSGGEAKSGT